MRNRAIISIILFQLLLPGLALVLPAQAQEESKLTLSITPPLIRNNVNPGQVWRSAVKLVNNNPGELSAYVEVVDFTGGREDGTVRLLRGDKSGESNTFLLSQWIEIDPGPIVIPAYSSQEIPFAIRVPEDAEPCGHYAAILAGTRPSEEKKDGTSLKVSSLLASLLLINIQGECVEKGLIREFSTDKRVYPDPTVDFTLRFENVGNVTIQPQGEIKIFDMWDEEQGRQVINHNTEFGNVLPESIRSWNFNWEGKKSLLNMGRYRAELILGYGTEARDTVNQTLYFWVIYFKPLLIIIGLITFLVISIVFIIRLYIRRAIKRTHELASYIAREQRLGPLAVKGEGRPTDPKNQRLRQEKTSMEIPTSPPKRMNWSFLKWFVFIMILVLIGIIIILIYVNSDKNQDNEPAIPTDLIQTEPVSNETDTETRTELKDGKTETIAEEPIMDISSSTATVIATATDEEAMVSAKPAVTVLNGSGLSGVASRMSDLLKNNGYIIARIGNADSYDYSRNLIKYSADFLDEAKLIKTIIGDGELSENLGSDGIIVVVGSEFK